MDNLSVKARQVRNAGRYEDTQLVHLSDEELALLKQQWGVPGKNPETGLPEYGLLGSLIKGVTSIIPGGKLAKAALGLGAGALGAAIGSKASKNSAPVAQYIPVPKDPTFSAKLPEAKGIFADLAAKPSGMTPEDYLTYGQVKRTPQGVTMGKTGAQFFNYAKSPEQQQPVVEANAYFDAYPDVAAEWARLSGSDEGKATLSAIGVTTPQQFAQYHYTTFGSKENRNAPVGYTPPVAVNPAPPVPVAPSDLAVQAAQPTGEIDPAILAQLSVGGMPQAYKKGGSVRKEFAVHGEGTGRSDSVPAVLSDGEYVIDAETVALLGDGSSKAGAKALDDFRVNIRKHKGAKLAQGKFSVKAKAPHHYMTGGKV
jgi:hypothetical protein